MSRRVGLDSFTVVDVQDAPVVLRWSYEPLRMPPGRAPVPPFVHEYRSFDGKLYEPVMHRHDWNLPVSVGDEVEDEVAGLGEAVLIDGLLHRPSTGPVFFMNPRNAWDEDDIPLLCHSAPSTNYLPEVDIGAIYCFDLLDEQATKMVEEAIGQKDVAPRSGVREVLGEIVGADRKLFKDNACLVLDRFLDKFDDDRLLETVFEAISAVEKARRTLDGIRTQDAWDFERIAALCGLAAEVMERRLESIAASGKRGRTHARIEEAQNIRNMLINIELLRLQCGRSLDARNELEGFSI